MKHLNTIDTIMVFLETFQGCSRATHWLIGCDLETARALWPMLERFYPDDSPTLDADFRFLTSTPATPDGRPCGTPRMMLALSKARMTARQFSWELKKAGYHRTERQIEEAEIIEIMHGARQRAAKWN
jgi:hypothetical protein